MRANTGVDDIGPVAMIFDPSAVTCLHRMADVAEFRHSRTLSKLTEKLRPPQRAGKARDDNRYLRPIVDFTGR